MTIITPAYNRADYLPEVVESVLSQEYEPLEYIVLDDGSTDNTVEVMQRYKDRVILESHANMGETRTVNKAFSMATGEIICVVNSDDPLRPNAIRIAVEFMQAHPEILVAYPDWEYIDAQGKVMFPHPVEEYDFERMLGEHICMPGPGAFFRREALDKTGGRDIEFKYVGDFEFWLRVALYGPMARIPQTLATFRVHPSSVSEAAKGVSMAREDIRMLSKYCRRDDLPEAARRIRRKAYSWAHYHAAQVCGKARWHAVKHVVLAFFYHPRSFIGSQYLYKRHVVGKIIYNAFRPLVPWMRKWKTMAETQTS